MSLLKIDGCAICYCVILCPQVLETYSYEDIGEVSTVKNSGLQLAMHTGGRVVVTTNKAGKFFYLPIFRDEFELEFCGSSEPEL